MRCGGCWTTTFNGFRYRVIGGHICHKGAVQQFTGFSINANCDETHAIRNHFRFWLTFHRCILSSLTSHSLGALTAGTLQQTKRIIETISDKKIDLSWSIVNEWHCESCGNEEAMRTSQSTTSISYLFADANMPGTCGPVALAAEHRTPHCEK